MVKCMWPPKCVVAEMQSSEGAVLAVSDISEKSQKYNRYIFGILQTAVCLRDPLLSFRSERTGRRVEPVTE